jgi:hypothetical protein
MTIREIFTEFAEIFQNKIDKEYHIKFQFEFTDVEKNNIWQIEVKEGNIFLFNEKKIDPEEVFTLTTETLIRLYNNELAPYTAFAMESNEKGALIDIKDKDEKAYLEKMKNEEKIQFIPRFHRFFDFFSKSNLNKIIINDKNSRKLHGANVTCLYSSGRERDFFYIYFSIKKGETIWEPPAECNILVISGKGTLSIGDEKYPINANEHYHFIPKKEIHIENVEEEQLNILYLILT